MLEKSNHGSKRTKAGCKNLTNSSNQKNGASPKVKKRSQPNLKQSVTETDKRPTSAKLVKVEESEGYRLEIVAQNRNEFGSNNDDFIEGILMQTIMASVHGSSDKQLKGNAALAAFTELQPNDPAEAMLISQMIAVHNMVMEMARRVSNSDLTVELITMYVNFVTKLMRTSTTQMEALSKYRNKGKQQITVKHQHVNVNDGGQAIVGDVTQGGGGQ